MSYRDRMHLMVGAIIGAGLTLGAGIVGITTATGADAAVTSQRVTVRTLPPCKHEDGSGQRSSCVWNAKNRGSGKGRSFLVIQKASGKRQYVYVSHRTACQTVKRYKRSKGLAPGKCSR